MTPEEMQQRLLALEAQQSQILAWLQGFLPVLTPQDLALVLGASVSILLAGWSKHYHVVRVYGSERANIHEWNKCQEDINQRQETESTIWEYDKEAYSLYTSTEDKHRIKIEIPRKLKRIPVYLALAALGVGGGIWGTFANFKQDAPAVARAPAETSSGGLFGTGKPGPRGQQKQEPLTAQQWIEQRTPRIPDLPHTAPAYDAITVPTQAPVIAACVVSASQGCKCYSQQATPLTVSTDVCMQFVKGGMFQEFTNPTPSRETTAEDRPSSRGTVPPMT